MLFDVLGVILRLSQIFWQCMRPLGNWTFCSSICDYDRLFIFFFECLSENLISAIWHIHLAEVYCLVYLFSIPQSQYKIDNECYLYATLNRNQINRNKMVLYIIHLYDTHSCYSRFELLFHDSKAFRSVNIADFRRWLNNKSKKNKLLRKTYNFYFFI